MSKKSAANSLDVAILEIVEREKPNNVSQLIGLLIEQIKISKAQALDMIIDLENRGKIKLATQSLPPSFKVGLYLKGSETRWFWATMIFGILTLFVVFLIPSSLQPWIYIRYVLAGIFVLFLPGYTFVRALFPVKPTIEGLERSLGRIERFALSAGFSLTIVPLFGLLLNYVIGSVSLVSIFVGLLLFSAVFASVALVREYLAKINKRIVINVKPHGR